MILFLCPACCACCDFSEFSGGDGKFRAYHLQDAYHPHDEPWNIWGEQVALFISWAQFNLGTFHILITLWFKSLRKYYLFLSRDSWTPFLPVQVDPWLDQVGRGIY